MNISFATAQTSAMFGLGISEAFDVHNKLVTFGVNSDNYITLAFAGGTMQLQGFLALKQRLSPTPSTSLVVLVLTAQLTSVTHSRSRPSADQLLFEISSLISNPFRGGFFMLSSRRDFICNLFICCPGRKPSMPVTGFAEVQLLGSAFVGQTSIMIWSLVIRYCKSVMVKPTQLLRSVLTRSFKHPCLIRNSLLTVATSILPPLIARMP